MIEIPDDIEARLKSLDQAIKAQKSRLELHGIFDKDHCLTESEIRERWRELQQEVRSELHDHMVLHEKADWIHGEIVKWVVSTDLDYKA